MVSRFQLRELEGKNVFHEGFEPGTFCILSYSISTYLAIVSISMACPCRYVFEMKTTW